MKKLLSLAAVVIGLNAYQIDIKSGWQLKGALEDINATSVFNESEIVSVWSYDSENSKWRAYLPNMNIDLSNYDNIEPLNVIHKGEGFWISANSELLIETGGVATFNLSDIANKTFKIFAGEGGEDFVDLTFDSNGIANIEIDGENYEIKLENGIIKVYENNDLIIEAKKVKVDDKGIILLAKELEDDEYSHFLWTWLTTINPVDMSTLNYPFTVYYYTEKITFENDRVLIEYADGEIEELNSFIEDGKIIVTEEEIYEDGIAGKKDISKIQYIGEIDKYKIARVDEYKAYWKIDNSLTDKTFSDIIGTNQNIFGCILNEGGTAFCEYDSDANFTYQLIDPTEINLTKCVDDDWCHTYKITLDSSTGKIKMTESFFNTDIEVFSESPIMINYLNNRVIFNNNLQKHKKLRKKPF